VSIKQDHQLFDSMKKLKTASGEAALQKLLSSQRRTIATNSALLHLYTRKVNSPSFFLALCILNNAPLFCVLQYQQCRDDVQALIQEFPTSELPYLILAAITLNEKKLPKALEELEVLPSCFPSSFLFSFFFFLTSSSSIFKSFKGKVPNAVLIPLTLAQLYLSQDNIEKAVTSLEAVCSCFHFF